MKSKTKKEQQHSMTTLDLSDNHDEFHMLPIEVVLLILSYRLHEPNPDSYIPLCTKEQYFRAMFGKRDGDPGLYSLYQSIDGTFVPSHLLDLVLNPKIHSFVYFARGPDRIMRLSQMNHLGGKMPQEDLKRLFANHVCKLDLNIAGNPQRLEQLHGVAKVLMTHTSIHVQLFGDPVSPVSSIQFDTIPAVIKELQQFALSGRFCFKLLMLRGNVDILSPESRAEPLEMIGSMVTDTLGFIYSERWAARDLTPKEYMALFRGTIGLNKVWVHFGRLYDNSRTFYSLSSYRNLVSGLYSLVTKEAKELIAKEIVILTDPIEDNTQPFEHLKLLDILKLVSCFHSVESIRLEYVDFGLLDDTKLQCLAGNKIKRVELLNCKYSESEKLKLLGALPNLEVLLDRTIN